MTEKVKRYFLFLVGLFVMALGIALMVKANLGISPISSPPYVFSVKFTAVSLGCFTILWNFLLILGQVAVLRRKFQWYQLIQIPLTLVFGVFVDSAKALLSGFIIRFFNRLFGSAVENWLTGSKEEKRCELTQNKCHRK